MKVHVNTKYGHSVNGQLVSDDGLLLILKTYNGGTVKVPWDNIDIYTESP